MTMPNKKLSKKLVTHNGSFHADDIFAAATLSMYLEKIGETFEIIRTRDPETIITGDYVFDVGGIYDEASNRFDHHQTGGAGTREDGISYAAFGLVWNKFGRVVCESEEISARLEKKIVESIDANDNGISLCDVKGEIAPLTIQDIFRDFRPSWGEVENYDEPFLELVNFTKKIINREIIRMRDAILAESLIKKNYDKAPNKKIITLDDNYPWNESIQNYTEPLYVVFPKANTWRVECVRKQKYSFETRKNFPASWAGLRDEELQKVTGVPGALFCHRGLFLVVAKSKEGAIKLAQIAVES
jgi:uncharacterized UPF0160 family protein